MVCGSRRKVDGSAQRGLTGEELHTENHDLSLLFSQSYVAEVSQNAIPIGTVA